ncbi:PQQ-binding-like beta-propeller repeat protein [Paraburkholderia sp. MMS20-SJTR3]|uniref:PQQ-binding-like beta-propeller repeat protein n=1 Tax=Paraburkholderia sejongensis TaxID=2886946 RepID=A0ABS8K232_9BURK|nr:PQQ-binding-like beta-propeller repeat protein [Paraburkholderia sp. MMS20-SJTR3]MCC8396217.1 PQQ-binding-like beta-propeller repeat protein [Paraburkholderia sp. MMS20-SJTR3]
MSGRDIGNSRNQPAQTQLGVNNAGSLALKWSHTVHGDVSATPAVVNGAVYFPDWAGYLTKLDANTGALIWEHRIDAYAGEASGAISRTSPAVVNGVIYIGDQNGANLLAIDANTGNLKWRTLLSNGPSAIITQSPIVYNGVVYVGVSSNEEGSAANIVTYPCCSFQGTFSAVDAATGAIKWTARMLPDNHGLSTGYSGAAVWSSSAAIDPASNTIYVTTGNNYSVPASVKACQLNGGSAAACLSSDDHVDSMVALDLTTGAIKWATGVQGYDTWNASCILEVGLLNNCPPPPGEDYDFGSGPNLITLANADGSTRLVVGAGQKSGFYWIFDAHTGAILSSTAVVPGSSLGGGIEWGTATDGKRVYIAGSDMDLVPYTINGATVLSGSFAALDPSTGKLLWQRADPTGSSLDQGAVSVSNGVMFAGSKSGHMYALNAATGDVLWDYPGQGSSNAGPAIDGNGTVYWGNGYSHLALFGTGSNTFYAFSVNGK